MHKVPHINFIRTLVAAKRTPSQILDYLEKYSLDIPPNKVIADTVKEFKKMQPDYYKDAKAKADIEWLESLGLDRMFGLLFDEQINNDITALKGAVDLMNDRLMYRLMTSLALAGVNPEDIELIINGKYDVEYSSENVDQFLFYFFDVAEWTYQEKRDYATTVTDQNLRMFFQLALQGDKPYLMWKLGIAPDKSFNTMLQDMFSDSYYNFKEYLQRNPDTANKFGTLALRISERLDKIEKEVGQKQDMFNDINFIMDNSEDIETTAKKKEIPTVDKGPLSPPEDKPKPFKKLTDLN